jgi:ParB family chromosome partitioning protein
LGKGLSALIPGAGQEVGSEVLELDVRDIAPNPLQPRTDIGDDQIGELADSIRKVGILQPIIVRPEGASYQIIAGERRWRGAQMAGLERVPVRVMATTETEALALALIENLQREDLNPIEEARGYRRLIA